MIWECMLPEHAYHRLRYTHMRSCFTGRLCHMATASTSHPVIVELRWIHVMDGTKAIIGVCTRCNSTIQISAACNILPARSASLIVYTPYMLGLMKVPIQCYICSFADDQCSRCSYGSVSHRSMQRTYQYFISSKEFMSTTNWSTSHTKFGIVHVSSFSTTTGP